MHIAFMKTLAVAALFVSGTVAAHHSFAMFDQKKVVTLKGTVSEFQWTNPHAFIHIQVADGSGGKQEWQVERRRQEARRPLASGRHEDPPQREGDQAE